MIYKLGGPGKALVTKWVNSNLLKTDFHKTSTHFPGPKPINKSWIWHPNNQKLQLHGNSIAWRIIPITKWLTTMVIKSPNWGCSPHKWPFMASKWGWSDHHVSVRPGIPSSKWGEFCFQSLTNQCSFGKPPGRHQWLEVQFWTNGNRCDPFGNGKPGIFFLGV